jgi:hypothetical protein
MIEGAAVASPATTHFGTVPWLAVDDFAEWGIVAGTTTRAAGTFGTHGDEPAHVVLGRWQALIDEAARRGVTAVASTHQVHGDTIHEHGPGWRGWLRAEAGDGHLWFRRGLGAAVSVADCVPVFLAHPSGAAAVLHSGWKGTAAGITERAIARFRDAGLAPADCRLHLGPSISGPCYEVSPEVHAAVTGRAVSQPTPVDLRGVIADRARGLGVTAITISAWCTRTDHTVLFSHRGGDGGRQLGVMLSLP